MNIAVFMFYFFEVVTAVTAVSMIFTRNVFYGALLMVICLISIAGLYVLMFAEFVAVTQILVYAGGILVVIIFGIMLTTKLSGKPLLIEHAYRFSGTLAGVLFFAVLVYSIANESFKDLPPSPTRLTEIRTIGVGLMTDFALPFEVAGLLLLVAL